MKILKIIGKILAALFLFAGFGLCHFLLHILCGTTPGVDIYIGAFFGLIMMLALIFS